MRRLLNRTFKNLSISAALAVGLALVAGVHPSVAKAADSDSKTRNFYEVLEDVLSDFEYDLKNGNVQGLKDLSVRNIAMSENVPPSFRSHLELLVSERILKTSKTRVIQCLQCRSKRTQLSGDKVVVSSPDSNPVELSRIAKENGILHFMDVSFAYQSSGMLLSLHITDPEQGTIIWSRTYNSENSRTSAARRGVDYSQIDDSRKQAEYVPTIQYRLGVLYLSEPNVGERTGAAGIGFRAVERYDNRHKEVGFEIDVLKNASSIVGSTSSTVDLYSGVNATLLFVHGWNFIGDEENYNHPRGSFMLGLGGTYASGFLGGLLRAQYEWRLGKSYAVSPTLGYRPKSTAFISSNPAGEVGGVEAGLGIHILF
ncbi:MAG: hypothetical protein ACJ763_18130 [Bdellovibrionia bacterium]